MDWNTQYQSRVGDRGKGGGMHQIRRPPLHDGQRLRAAAVARRPRQARPRAGERGDLPGSFGGAVPITSNQAMEGHLRVNTVFISANVRKAVQEGRADFTPVLLSEVPLLFKNGVLPLDVALVHVSPPDEHGFCSFGVEVGLTKSPAEFAKMIIAEVNEQMPRTLGDSFIHVSRLDCIVPVNYPVAELIMGGEGNDDISQKIASYIAELIPDGATMQMGIGGIPDAVLNFLGDKRDLGVHSEMFSDGVVRLVEKGVITNSREEPASWQDRGRLYPRHAGALFLGA